MHKGINKVVSNKKNKDIPSTPKEKLKFKTGNQLNWVTNWKKPEDLLKAPQTSKELKKDKKDAFSETNFSNTFSRAGIKHKVKIPIIGNINV